MLTILRWRDRIEAEAGLGIILAIQFVTIFVVAPLAATASASFQLIEMLRFGLAATTILIVARRPLVRLIVGIAFVGTLAASLQWRIGEPASVVSAIKLMITLAFDCTVAGTVAFTAFGPGRVTVHRILGAVILYLYVAIIFANLYRVAALIVFPSFDGLPADPRARFAGLLYFSLGALTTNGGSAIVAVHPLVRSLTSLEAVIGQIFPATLLARLVTLHAAASAPPSAED